MTDTDEKLRQSVAGYIQKYGGNDFVEQDAQDWIRADVETFEELSPSDRGALIATGLSMVRAAIRDDRVTKRDAGLDVIRSRWPGVIAPDAKFFVGMGWLPLLEHAAERVVAYRLEWNARLVGGKEKFGCLVLHVAYDRDSRGSRSEIERMREEVRLMSLSVCEICGRPGRLRMAGYAKTVCDAHAREMGVMRDDDGLYADSWAWAEPDARPWKTEIVVLGVRVMQVFFADVEALEAEAETLEGRTRELLAGYAGYLVDSAKGAVVKTEYLPGYAQAEVDGWPDVLELSEDDRDWLRTWLMKMIVAEYERVERKQRMSPSQS